MAGSWTEILDSSKLGSPGGLAQLDSSGLLKENQVPTILSTKISGLIAASSIPDIDASKIKSGTLATARVPDLDASKITTGSFSANRIPTLELSKISGLSTALDKKVETTTTINGKALTGNISINKSDVGLSKVEDKSSAMIRAELSIANITNTGIDTSNLIKEVSELPASGVDGQMVKFDGALYVWKGTS